MSQPAISRHVGEPLSFRNWLLRPNVQKWLVVLSFSLVPIVLLITFTYVPFARMFQFSFYNMSYTKTRGFVGLQNYLDIFRKEEFSRSLLLSLYYMGGALVQMALALYFATILSFGVKGGGVFKGVLFFPYLINGIAIGFIFKFFYTRGFVLDTVLQALGIPLESLPYWLRDQSINNISLVATSVWKYMGQNMVLFIGAIMSVDPTLYEAATVDGANKWHQFRFVILPSIRTVLMLNLILSITGSLSAFEPPYVIMGGGANGTATYFIKMHETAHTLQKVGMASAMAVFLMLIILIAAVIQQVAFKHAFKRYDA
jgi:multiple sugar transport system permease protein